MSVRLRSHATLTSDLKECDEEAEALQGLRDSWRAGRGLLRSTDKTLSLPVQKLQSGWFYVALHLSAVCCLLYIYDTYSSDAWDSVLTFLTSKSLTAEPLAQRSFSKDSTAFTNALTMAESPVNDRR